MVVTDKIALTLIIVGALNWLTIALFGFDFVAAIFGGSAAVASRIVYGLVGLAGLWGLTILFKRWKRED